MLFLKRDRYAPYKGGYVTMTVPYLSAPKNHAFDIGLAGGWLQAILMWLTGAAVVLLLVLPVLILFAGTAVPWFISLFLLAIDIPLVWYIARSSSTASVKFMGLAAMAIVAVVAVILSQQYASTRPITNVAGEQLPNSIAVMEKVTLGGSEQWITIRGKDVESPVLLYLGIGGPGAGGFPASVMNLAPLEDHFVVVNWDQPGTGKSYGAVPISTLTVQRFVDDAYQLTEMMRARFGEEKIYVFGLSWGTIVGIKLMQQHPDLYYAYVGNGQMVNTVENDRIGYEFALDYERAQGNLAAANRLQRNGPPPYSGRGMALKYADYNNSLFRYMDSPTLEMILLMAPQFAREYGLVDRVNFARGLLDSFPVLYPQLRDLDFVTQAATLQVPVYFLVGQNDINSVASLVERYYDVLDAPYKELVWVEGGHGATPEQIADAMVTKVLAQNPPLQIEYGE
jgi:pimeloyl-ACP methyl ester carboxylesterase